MLRLVVAVVNASRIEFRVCVCNGAEECVMNSLEGQSFGVLDTAYLV